MRVGLAAETLKTLGELKGRCARLVDAGLVQVAELWARLPKVRVDVAREGRQLKLELSASTIDARTGDLVRRSCIWYAGVQRMSARAHGRVVDPRVAEVEDVLMDYRPPEDEPPRGATEALVTAVLILNDVVGDIHSDLIEVKKDVSDLKAGQQRLLGEASDLRGLRYEKGAHRAIKAWLDAYAATRSYTNLEVELLWSDRLQDADYSRWRAVRNELGIPDARAIWNCDFLTRTTWTQADGSDIKLLIVGNVSIEMNKARQTEVRTAHAALTERGHRVLPMQFGIRFSEQGPLPELRHLVSVRNTDDDLWDRDAINDALAAPPAAWWSSLDGLLGTEGRSP